VVNKAFIGLRNDKSDLISTHIEYLVFLWLLFSELLVFLLLLVQFKIIEIQMDVLQAAAAS